MREIDRSLTELESRIRKSHMAQPEADALFERIVQERVPAGQRSRSPWKSPFRVSILAVAVAVIGGALIIGPDLLQRPPVDPAVAATPKLLKVHMVVGKNTTAEKSLESIARKVEKLQEPNGAESGPFIQETWSLTTRIGGMQITSAVVPERRETWKMADGSTKWSVKAEKPQFQNDEQRSLWERQWDAIDEPVDRSGTGDVGYGDAPKNPAEMEAWLHQGAPADTAGFISESVVDKLMTNHLNPEQRAALLRVLATKKGLVTAGEVTDRAGRQGAAYTIKDGSGSIPAEHMIIVDPVNGKILAYEEIFLSSSPAMKVEGPAVVNYVTFLKG
ncbi:CU044_5270 family protein [Streptomyces sp. NPDC017524]|uniref:CU044_5270 family protein n=1 Tax=unclassified Streptomyces TaxID=2593676 RepID=UPI0037AEC4D5